MDVTPTFYHIASLDRVDLLRNRIRAKLSTCIQGINSSHSHQAWSYTFQHALHRFSPLAMTASVERTSISLLASNYFLFVRHYSHRSSALPRWNLDKFNLYCLPILALSTKSGTIIAPSFRRGLNWRIRSFFFSSPNAYMPSLARLLLCYVPTHDTHLSSTTAQ